eukprot:TRINITY_DN17399_c0_g1_i6.p3 TRINITY_DN17399_c0_g1~~TRINITY_DN17399_c0_g1_i6.p3  ORF type:complete len:108 (+),score=0.58 TRINITY_DN17399_c0_g1_i6:417-740(+)
MQATHWITVAPDTLLVPALLPTLKLAPPMDPIVYPLTRNAPTAPPARLPMTASLLDMRPEEEAGHARENQPLVLPLAGFISTASSTVVAAAEDWPQCSRTPGLTCAW